MPEPDWHNPPMRAFFGSMYHNIALFDENLVDADMA